MITHFMGIEYGRGACATPRDGGPALAPATVRDMFPDTNWTMVRPAPVDINATITDRFGENTPVQIAIYNNTPRERHIMIGGDHSVNFGHFAALADQLDTSDLCMVYVDAHLDIHSPESSRAEASGLPKALFPGRLPQVYLPPGHAHLRPPSFSRGKSPALSSLRAVRL